MLLEHPCATRRALRQCCSIRSGSVLMPRMARKHWNGPRFAPEVPTQLLHVVHIRFADTPRSRRGRLRDLRDTSSRCERPLISAPRTQGDDSSRAWCKGRVHHHGNASLMRQSSQIESSWRHPQERIRDRLHQHAASLGLGPRHAANWQSGRMGPRPCAIDTLLLHKLEELKSLAEQHVGGEYGGRPVR